MKPVLIGLAVIVFGLLCAGGGYLAGHEDRPEDPSIAVAQAVSRDTGYRNVRCQKDASVAEDAWDCTAEDRQDCARRVRVERGKLREIEPPLSELRDRIIDGC